MLFTHWERRYPYLSGAMPLAEEGLLVPFYINGKAVGTIWTIAHRTDRKFDAEDLRLLESMGRFASAAYQTVQSIEEVRSEIAAREKAETELRKLTDSPEAEVRVRTQELEHRNAELAEARARAAEVARVTSLGVLTASIAHEVNQPIAAARNNAVSALRFLSRSPPDLEEVREALDCVVSDVDRAGNVIGGIRKLITKTPAPRDDCFDINEAIREMIVLTRGEALKNGVSVLMQLAEGLPLIQGDRVQLQQVVLNLILNAVESMSSVDGARRELSIGTGRREADEILVAVRDSGPGIDPEHLERVFDSFYTTKPDGMGLGLSICLVPRLDQARVEFDTRHPGHMDVSNQAGGLVETARCEKIGCRWESFDGVTQRPHEPSHGLAKELIILDDRDQWRVGQSALRHRARPSPYRRSKRSRASA